MHLIIIGPQASGKGTQAEMLAHKLGLSHISIGERLRQEVAAKTEVGLKVKEVLERGDLVPDEFIYKIAEKYVKEHDDGFILDGFPRTEEQATWLDEKTKIDAVIHLQVSDEVGIERVAGRRECPKGHDYHLTYNPPNRENCCDIDGLPLRQRSDDTEERTRHRLQIYHAETEPLLNHYGKKILAVDGSQSIAKVHMDIMKGLRG